MSRKSSSQTCGGETCQNAWIGPIACQTCENKDVFTAEEIRNAGGFEKWKKRESKKRSKIDSKVHLEELVKRYEENMQNLQQERHQGVKKGTWACEGGWLKLLAMPGVDLKPNPGTMNRWESEHARHLFNLVMAEEISGYCFEKFRLDLGGKVKLIPDFFRLNNDGSFDVDDVKGFIREDSLIKFKIAAHQYPQFTFRFWTKKCGVWQAKIIGGANR